MSVESVSTSVNVSESMSVAAATAPSGNTLEAASAKTEVSSEFIKNFMSPVADYAEYVNYAPGTFSLNPNGIGLGQGKTFLPRFPGRAIHHDVRWDSVRRYQYADAPFLGELSERLDRRRRFRPQPRPFVEFRPHQLRRIDQSAVAAIVSGPGHPRDGRLRLVGYARSPIGRRQRLFRAR
jgi:hypothetical protein